MASSTDGGIHTFLIADVRGYNHFTIAQGDEAALQLTVRFEAISSSTIRAWRWELGPRCPYADASMPRRHL
jgi:hypothetical protein